VCREAAGKLLGSDTNSLPHARCENLNVLVNQLERILQGKPRFILVFDGIDRQREAAPTLMPALARFASFVRDLLARAIGCG
jgi:origin recognition complex subunit 5